MVTPRGGPHATRRRCRSPARAAAEAAPAASTSTHYSMASVGLRPRANTRLTEAHRPLHSPNSLFCHDSMACDGASSGLTAAWPRNTHMPGPEQRPAGHQRDEGQRQQGDRQRAYDGVDVRRRCRIRQCVHAAANRPFGASRDSGTDNALPDARATRMLLVQTPPRTLACKTMQ